MKTKEDIESFLLQAGVPHSELSEGLWMTGESDEPQHIVLRYAPPVLVARVNVMEIPSDAPREELYKTLLELNASEMMHGAYGIEDGKIIISDALQLENLDFNEFQATLDDISMAVADHYARLARFRGAAASA